MTTIYKFPLPPNVLPANAVFAAVPGTIPQPDQVYTEDDGATIVLEYLTGALTAAQRTNFTTLLGTNPQPANAPWIVQAQASARLQNVVGALNNQAAQLAALSPNGVTAGNVVAVVQGIVNNLAVDLARLADLIVALQAGN